MADGVTNSKLYDLVDRTRLELKSDIIRVDTKVDLLSTDVNRLKEKEANLSAKVYILVSIITIVIASLISAISLRVLR